MSNCSKIRDEIQKVWSKDRTCNGHPCDCDYKDSNNAKCIAASRKVSRLETRLINCEHEIPVGVYLSIIAAGGVIAFAAAKFLK